MKKLFQQHSRRAHEISLADSTTKIFSLPHPKDVVGYCKYKPLLWRCAGLTNPRSTNESEIFICLISPLVLNRTIDLWVKVRTSEPMPIIQHGFPENLSGLSNGRTVDKTNLERKTGQMLFIPGDTSLKSLLQREPLMFLGGAATQGNPEEW